MAAHPASPLDQTTETVVAGIRQAAQLYNRLVLVPLGARNIDALAAVSEHTGAPVLNIGLELSQRMLE